MSSRKSGRTTSILLGKSGSRIDFLLIEIYVLTFRLWKQCMNPLTVATAGIFPISYLFLSLYSNVLNILMFTAGIEPKILSAIQEPWIAYYVGSDQVFNLK